MKTSRSRYRPSRALAAGLILACGTPMVRAVASADDSAPVDTTKTLPQSGLISSLKQAVKQGYDHEAVRGYFELGPSSNHHRYYCLVDLKTGQPEPNGVLGQPMPLPSGMTGIKVDSVSLYLCADAQREGMLVTEGFVLNGAAAKVAATAPPAVAAAPPATPPVTAPPVTAPSPVAAPATVPPPVPAAPAAVAASPGLASGGAGPASATQVDVSGLKLGMSADEVRAVLKSKKLREYRESSETLSSLSAGAMQPLASGRFVNIVAAWSSPPSQSVDNFQVDGESYEVMFTPVPGRERAMAIVRSTGYSPSNALRETVLETGLARKYGGFAAGAVVPQSPTWRVQAGGTVATGDACGRRATFGGLSGLSAASARDNVALKLGAEELRFQVEHCGVAIVTEDHFTANGGAQRDDRIVTRFTVTAFSPSIALEGAKSAGQLIQAAAAQSGANLASKREAAPEL